MRAIHLEVLDMARTLANDRSGWTFHLAELVRRLPHLNPGTVRTHVASRCCTNAPSHHQSRYPYFRAIGRGVYRIEPAFRNGRRSRTAAKGWADDIVSALESGVDATLIAESLRLTPTERLDQMQWAARGLASITRR